ncbi:hypothetical protein BpHYR1_048838 [Brachionus plicatilis]|uniref:Uncharacterized protein n=1 Tax=Brachionus plicatilis TaxID=10195 RepID=A0A3M7S657_BRAPC|nr:hypothetical protein BpHYR1_048838 [Brachionus plicatilis]
MLIAKKISIESMHPHHLFYLDPWPSNYVLEAILLLFSDCLTCKFLNKRLKFSNCFTNNFTKKRLYMNLTFGQNQSLELTLTFDQLNLNYLFTRLNKKEKIRVPLTQDTPSIFQIWAKFTPFSFILIFKYFSSLRNSLKIKIKYRFVFIKI